jgi:beta-N-acetylhexosaminidase
MSPRALRHEIGQLLVAGFNGTTVPTELRALAREFSLAGLILFKRNVEDPEQVAELARSSAELTPDVRPWVSVDQEGGRVARLKRPFTEWPPALTLGRSARPDLARRFARALAAELAAVGITLDFAPVLDILTNPANPVIGDRALAARAELVSELGSAIIDELQQAGIAACGKHFPGLGEVALDPHFDLPLVEHAPDRLRAVEFEPFRAAVAAGVASMMTAHVLVPALDENVPATMSARIIAPLLRMELGFDGVIFTDDMEMKAVAARWPVPEACVLAIAAGCDAVLICSGDHDLQHAALEALVHAVEEERLPFARVEDALVRQRRMKERFLAQPTLAGSVRRGPFTGRALRAVLGCESHQAVADEMAQYL